VKRLALQFIFCVFLLAACQNSVESESAQFANDPQAQADLSRIKSGLSQGGVVSGNDFEALKSLVDKYPNVPEVGKAYRSVLVIRNDFNTLEKFLLRNGVENLNAEETQDLARVYIKNGKSAEALGILAPLIENSKSDVQLRSLAGVCNFNLGRFEEAGREFDAVWDEILSKKMVNEIATRGVAYYRLREKEKAIEVLKSAIDLDPDHITSNYTLSRIYGEMGDTAKAKYYQKKTDEIQNRMKAATKVKSRQVVDAYDLEKAWEGKNYNKVIEIATRLIPNMTDRGQRLILYRYLQESYLALGSKAEAEKAEQEIRKLESK